MEAVAHIACTYTIDKISHTIASINIRHLFDYKRPIKDLRFLEMELKEVQRDVIRRVEEEERNSRVISTPVQEWLRRVDILLEESDELLRAEELVNHKCFIGLCPDLRLRYQVTKKAEKRKILTVNELNRYRNGFDIFSYPPPRAEFIIARGFEVFESRKSTLDDILEALKDDQINTIGVYGMGGVGKTVLVKEVAIVAKNTYLFDAIVMVVVSQVPDIRRIQDIIADTLGLVFHEESIFGRAGRLYARIKNEQRILVILDDMWAELDLSRIGIPYSNDHRGCKIIITSRALRVCQSMNAQINFPIQVLIEDEAWALFKEKAGDSLELPNFRPIAIEIAKECGGLPLAIITVAGALRGKDYQEWRHVLRQLKSSKLENVDMDTHIYSALKLSYDFLRSELLQTCFLLCCLFPEDSDIPIEYLVRYGMGLNLFHDDNLIDARDAAHTCFAELKVNCLLLDGNDKGSIRMHDVVRDFAISMASRGDHPFLVRAGLKMIEWPPVDAFNRYRAISLIGNRIVQFPPDGLNCPNLEILLLECDPDRVEISDAFFTGMENLKVVHIRRLVIQSMPLSFGSLMLLRTLFLECCKIEDLKIIDKLKSLEILSIAGSDVVKLEIGSLVSLRLLNLTDCKNLVIPSGDMARLIRLECLYMRNSFTDWGNESDDNQGIGRSNASLSELKGLRNLQALEMHIPNVELYPKYLSFDKLIEYKIAIGSDFDLHDKHSYMRNLKLEGCLSITLEGGGGVNLLLKRAELVVLKDLKVVENVLCDLTDDGYSNMKCLRVDHCDGIEYLVNTKRMPHRVFPMVEILDISYMWNLRMICQGHLPSISFSELLELRLLELPELINLWEYPIGNTCFGNLRVVMASDCDKLKYLFWKHMARDLKQLQELDVRSCSNMEEILAKGGEGPVAQVDQIVFSNMEDTFAQADEILFPELKSMKLMGLPNLTSFCCETNRLASDSSHDASALEPLFSRKVVFPSLEELYLWGLDNMKEIWHMQFFPSESFYRLRKLSVGYCKKLTVVIPLHVGEMLKNLEEFSVWDCDLVEEVCKAYDITSSILPQIKALRLWGLPRLKHIWWNKVSPGFSSLQNLKILRIYKCEGLRNLFSIAASKGLNQLQTLTIRKCDLMKEIVAGVSQEEDEAVDTIMFPQLHTLELKHMLQLTSFYQGKCTLNFISLEKLVIENCPLMKTFTENPEVGATVQPFFSEKSSPSGHLLTPKLHCIKVGNLKELCKGDLNSTIQHLSEQKKLGGEEGKEDEQTVTAQQFNKEIIEEKEDKV